MSVKVAGHEMRVTPEGVVRTLVMAGGFFLGIVGLGYLWNTVSHDQWFRVVVWAGGGVILNDAILAPVGVVVGLLLLPRVTGPAWRRTLRAASLLLVGVLFALIPLLATGGLR